MPPTTPTDEDLIVQTLTFPDGKHRIVLRGEWSLDYFNVRDGVTDLTLTPREKPHG